MGIISIEGMAFFAHHGCFSEEQLVGTHFEVDIFLETETHEAEQTDDLAKTVNYQEIYQLVKAEMAVSSKLLEHIARRILDRIAANYPAVTSAKVKISKLHPPVGGQVERVSVALNL
ncbi:MAG: dihydroneopterin aldolase [Bacteroidales bacterium]|nr:dihydroneopterin aldolase [Bacteroidales bacterium]